MNTISVPDTNGTTIHLPRDFVAHLYSRVDAPFVEDNIRLSQPIVSRFSKDNITTQSNPNSPSDALASRGLSSLALINLNVQLYPLQFELNPTIQQLPLMEHQVRSIYIHRSTQVTYVTISSVFGYPGLNSRSLASFVTDHGKG